MFPTPTFKTASRDSYSHAADITAATPPAVT